MSSARLINCFVLSHAGVLEYHVVPAVGYSAGLSCGDNLKTLNGESVKITKAFGTFNMIKSAYLFLNFTIPKQLNTCTF